MPEPVSIENVADVFAYHQPDDKQIEAMTSVRRSAVELASTILAYAPDCADRSAAIRLLRQAVREANSAIALRGRV